MSDAPTSRAEGVRERARADMLRQILDVAREQLAVQGASGLSLRAVAREMGMVSSAVYRYVPSRDELLTRLIVEAYDALGAAAEQAEAEVPRLHLAARFRAVAHAVRAWAIDNEHEYALIFGSPVPGYRAPEATIPPATRVPTLLIGVIRDAVAAGALPADRWDVPDPVAAALAPVQAAFDEPGPPVPADLVVRGLMAWTHLFGAVSFDLFGHRHNVVLDERAVDSAFFAYEVDRVIAMVGLPETLSEEQRRRVGSAGVSRPADPRAGPTRG